MAEFGFLEGGKKEKLKTEIKQKEETKTEAKEKPQQEQKDVIIGQLGEWDIYPSLKTAIFARRAGEKALSPREADICKRNPSLLENELFLHSIATVEDLFITEDSKHLNRGAYRLRARYNQGIEWKKNKRHKCDPATQQKGDNQLLKIKESLTSLGLGLTEEEEENGFEQDLLKPEYESWETFHKNARTNNPSVKDKLPETQENW